MCLCLCVNFAELCISMLYTNPWACWTYGQVHYKSCVTVISSPLTTSLAWWLRRLPEELKIPGSNPACTGIFPGSSHISDFNIGTLVATLTGAWRYRVSAGTGWPGVSILWLGEMESLVCNFHLSVEARTIVPPPQKKKKKKKKRLTSQAQPMISTALARISCSCFQGSLRKTAERWSTAYGPFWALGCHPECRLYLNCNSSLKTLPKVRLPWKKLGTWKHADLKIESLQQCWTEREYHRKLTPRCSWEWTKLLDDRYFQASWIDCFTKYKPQPLPIPSPPHTKRQLRNAKSGKVQAGK